MFNSLHFYIECDTISVFISQAPFSYESYKIGVDKIDVQLNLFFFFLFIQIALLFSGSKFQIRYLKALGIVSNKIEI